MTRIDPEAAFAAFREAVSTDADLAATLRPPLERDAYVAHVVALGAARGFVFDAAAVRAAMREGEARWLMLGADVL